jgi:hypothetical protein
MEGLDARRKCDAMAERGLTEGHRLGTEKLKLQTGRSH